MAQEDHEKYMSELKEEEQRRELEEANQENMKRIKLEQEVDFFKLVYFNYFQIIRTCLVKELELKEKILKNIKNQTEEMTQESEQVEEFELRKNPVFNENSKSPAKLNGESAANLTNQLPRSILLSQQQTACKPRTLYDEEDNMSSAENIQQQEEEYMEESLQEAEENAEEADQNRQDCELSRTSSLVDKKDDSDLNNSEEINDPEEADEN